MDGWTFSQVIIPFFFFFTQRFYTRVVNNPCSRKMGQAVSFFFFFFWGGNIFLFLISHSEGQLSTSCFLSRVTMTQAGRNSAGMGHLRQASHNWAKRLGGWWQESWCWQGALPGHRRLLPLSEPFFEKSKFGMLRPIFRQLHIWRQKYSTYIWEH